jgi:hypothetical protein
MTIPAVKIITPLPPNATKNLTNITTSSPTKYITRHIESLGKMGLAKSSSHVQDDPWVPAYNECKHIFGTFILPSVLHLSAYFIGFYLYRIREHEGLYVLMEKVLDVVIS